MKLLIRFCLEMLIYLLSIGIVQGLSVDRKVTASQSARFYDKSGICKETGYKRNETDSSQFYRCVDYYGSGKKYVIFKFSCPPALEFDEKVSTCVLSRKSPIPVATNNPDPSTTLASDLSSYPPDPEIDILTLYPPSTSTNAITELIAVESSSTVVPATVPSIFESVASSLNSQDKVIQTAVEMDCSSNKFYRLPNSDCNQFYQCHQRSVNIFSCSPGLVFDEAMERCLLPEESSCDQQLTNNPIAYEIFDYSEVDCSSGHFHRYPFNCRNFYQCYNNGLTKSILFYSCSSGLMFDEKSSKCLLPYETSPCYAANESSPFKSSPFLYNLQRLFQSSPS